MCRLLICQSDSLALSFKFVEFYVHFSVWFVNFRSWYLVRLRNTVLDFTMILTKVIVFAAALVVLLLLSSWLHQCSKPEGSARWRRGEEERGECERKQRTLAAHGGS